MATDVALAKRARVTMAPALLQRCPTFASFEDAQKARQRIVEVVDDVFLERDAGVIQEMYPRDDLRSCARHIAARCQRNSPRFPVFTENAREAATKISSVLAGS